MKSFKITIIAILAVLIIGGAAFMAGIGFTLVPNTASASQVLYSEDTVTGNL
ncbi:hypothetical protein ACFLXC_01170 [Chloroflexota bacterium]